VPITEEAAVVGREASEVVENQISFLVSDQGERISIALRIDGFSRRW
jgi:hypothetical protein